MKYTVEQVKEAVNFWAMSTVPKKYIEAYLNKMYPPCTHKKTVNFLDDTKQCLDCMEIILPNE